MAKDLIEFIAKSIVDDPSVVALTQVEKTECTILELRVSLADRGKVIGKDGRIVKAMRLLLAAASGVSSSNPGGPANYTTGVIKPVILDIVD